MGSSCDFTYNRSSFESDAINTFFSPQKAINLDMDIENWIGEINIKLSPFQDTTREFNYLDSKCQLGIPRHVRFNKDPT